MGLFRKRAGRRLGTPHVERWLDSTAVSCAAHCRRARGFLCRSFGYHAARRLCTLSEDNMGRVGAEQDSQWDLYELKDEAEECQEEESRFLCRSSGQCLSKDRVCDGKDDCGDGSDEKLCKEKPNINVSCKLF